MTTERLRDFIRATPFRPFIVHLADGREFYIAHPEMIAHASPSRIAVLALPNDSIEVVDLLMIVSLETTGTASAQRPTNGPSGP